MLTLTNPNIHDHAEEKKQDAKTGKFYARVLLLLWLISFFLSSSYLSLPAPPAPVPTPTRNHNHITHVNERTDDIQSVKDVFPGPLWRTSQTLSARTLLSNKWVRVESHVVKTEKGTVDDWIWMDVVDQVNVLAYMIDDVSKGWDSGEFAVFRQRKYGLEQETLAVVGGHIEIGRERALDAAKRELKEEMNLKAASDDDWIHLGTFRTNANRGGGYCSCYLAIRVRKDQKDIIEESFHVDELERQEIIWLSYSDLLNAVSSGRFGEVKWTATIGLGLLEIQRRERERQASLPKEPVEEAEY